MSYEILHYHAGDDWFWNKLYGDIYFLNGNCWSFAAGDPFAGLVEPRSINLDNDDRIGDFIKAVEKCGAKYAGESEPSSAPRGYYVVEARFIPKICGYYQTDVIQFSDWHFARMLGPESEADNKYVHKEGWRTSGIAKSDNPFEKTTGLEMSAGYFFVPSCGLRLGNTKTIDALYDEWRRALSMRGLMRKAAMLNILNKVKKLERTMVGEVKRNKIKSNPKEC
ncbi:MAG: hypothetical protein LBL21_01780 [Rickettsiales bacterium]|jgi:hypothetical protein|nr:hypothetical protein [Rickettsiales bacterium]